MSVLKLIVPLLNHIRHIRTSKCKYIGTLYFKITTFRYEMQG